MNQHKDLPSGSQTWAKEVDALMDEVKHLREVVRRLSENAGLDYSNPKRGLNSGAAPSANNPVGQKLSSLADVGTYDVLDKQVLSWSQQGQKWLPVTLPTPTAGGMIDISEVSYSTLAQAYGVLTSPTEYTYNGAGVVDNAFGPDRYYIENWTTGSAYFGSGDWNTGTGYSLVELSPGDGFGRPYVSISADDYVDGTGTYLVVASYQVRINGGTFDIMAVTSDARPDPEPGTREGASVYDFTLKKPIWWDGDQWTDALGTPV